LSNLDVLSNYPIQHISAYHLTIEPGTKFGKLKRQNKLSEYNDSESEKIFWTLHDKAAEMGFEHYEISNFCRNGFYSRHNTAYWDNIPYLGIGPSAHSFDGKKRYWNKSNLSQYIKQGFSAGVSYETLTSKDRFNEYLMLRLRTNKGINVNDAEKKFDNYWNRIEPEIHKWILADFLEKSDGYIYASRKGWFVIDGIIEDLFIL
jgi:oxygen-independent coproporphyrinogen-3 oxidase